MSARFKNENITFKVEIMDTDDVKQDVICPKLTYSFA